MDKLPERKDTRDKTDWLHHIRSMELDRFSGLLGQSQGKRLLEIGGGDGFLAQRLSQVGFDVVSIDVAPRMPLLYPVREVSAARLDFPDDSFDIVFSSHVIAHIRDRLAAMEEMRRVLSPSGLALHIVPSPWWTVITNLWHFGILPWKISRSLLKRITRFLPTSSHAFEKSFQVHDSKTLYSGQFRSLLRNPLGENPSFVHELFYFSKKYWSRTFEEAGFEVLEVQNGPMLQSGYRMFPFRCLGLRAALGQVFPSSFGFLLRPR